MPCQEKTKEGLKYRGRVMVAGVRSSSKLFDTKKEARDWEGEERKRMKRYPQTSNGMALNIFCMHYLREMEMRSSKKTFLEKKILCKRICDQFGKNTPVGQVTPNQVAVYLGQRAKAVSNNTANRDRKNLLSMWNWGRDQLDITTNPAVKFRKLPHETKPQRVPNEEEVRKLLDVADRHDRIFILTACLTGARKSELFRLTWSDDIDFGRRTIRLGNRKSRSGEMKYRYAPMNDMLYTALREQWETRLPHSDYVFQNRAAWIDKNSNVVRLHPNYGQRFTARRKFMSGLCKKAKIEAFGLHSLRRFFASLLADKYHESIPMIQVLLGHASVNTTERYVRAISNDVKRAVDQITLDLPEDFFTRNLPEMAKGQVAQPPNPLI
jgi:integrase